MFSGFTKYEKGGSRMADLSVEQKILLEEWKEARNSIARFDEHLISLRKYGFTLATLLLTADAYLTMGGNISITPLLMFSVAVVVIALISALFLLDQHIRAFLIGASKQAIRIEKKEELKELKLTTRLEDVAKKKQTTWGGTPVYFIFVLGTGFLGCMELFHYGPSVPGSTEVAQQTPINWIVALIIISLAVSIFMYWYSQEVKKAAGKVFEKAGKAMVSKAKELLGR